MKYSKLNSVYEEWIRSVEAKETDRTFCAVDVDIWEEGPNIKQECRIVGFGMDKNMCEVFEGIYGNHRDIGRSIWTYFLDLTKKLDKTRYNGYFKDGKVIFGDWDKLRRFHF